MQTTNTQIEGITAADLLANIKQIVSQAVATYTPKPPKEENYLSRKEVAELFEVSLPTIHAWSKAGIITPYKMGVRVLFKKEEIMAAPKPIPSRYGTKKGGENE